MKTDGLILETICGERASPIRIKGRSDIYRPRGGKTLGVLFFFLSKESWGKTYYRDELVVKIGVDGCYELNSSIRSINRQAGAELISMHPIPGTNRYTYQSNIRKVVPFKW